MSQVDPEIARRLALIRLLLARATEMAKESPPFSFDSINRLHDAAEMFLALAAQVHGVAIPRDFTGYWDALQSVTGSALGYRVKMQKFNKVRVNLKHYGVEPAAAEMTDASVTVSAFLFDECEPLFGVALEDVSLTAFMSCDASKQLVESAQVAWDSADTLTAMADISDAFDVLISDYEKRKMLGHNLSVFDSTPDMTFLSPFFRKVVDRKEKEFDQKVIEALKNLDFAVMLIGFGVDFRRYGKFKANTPHTAVMADQSRRVYRRRGAPETDQATYDFCRDFVVSTALHLADFDYDLDWEQAYRAALAQDTTVVAPDDGAVPGEATP